MTKSLSPTDILVFSLYLLVSVGIGLRFTGQKKLKSYLLADQDMNYIVVAISIIAAFFSGISYLGAPAETFHHDLRYLWVLLSFAIATPITALLFLPKFYNAGVVSVNEYLEQRFDRRLRVLASALFILRATVYLSIATYAPALVIATATGWPIWISVLVCGLSTTLYTALGGMKAVLWTDTFQFIVLFSGILCILGAISHLTPGGLPGAWNLAAGGGKTQFLDFSLDPRVRVTLWGGLIGGAATNLVQMVTDQVAVQRYLTARSLSEARRALWFKLLITIPMVSLFFLTGTFLAGYYRAFPARLGTLASPDALLPRFVLDTLPSPLPGLLIAAVFAATMSTVSAGINSLATIALVDFGNYNIGADADVDNPKEEARALRRAKLMTVGFGLLITFLASFAGSLGSLVEAPNRAFGLLGGPLLGIFFLGALKRRCSGTSALVGIAAGAIACVVSMQQAISFLWFGFVGALVTFMVALGVSYLVRSQAQDSTEAEPSEKSEGLALLNTMES